MPVNRYQLNDKYKPQNQLWDYTRLVPWLEKKGIPNTKDLPIAETILAKVMLESTLDNLPTTYDAFDRMLYLRAIKFKNQVNEELRAEASKRVDKLIEESLAVYDGEWNAMSKTKKIWEVIRGRA